MRITSRSAVSRVAQPGPVPARVRSAAAARNRNDPAKRSFRGVGPRVFPWKMWRNKDGSGRMGTLDVDLNRIGD